MNSSMHAGTAWYGARLTDRRPTRPAPSGTTRQSSTARQSGTTRQSSTARQSGTKRTIRRPGSDASGVIPPAAKPARN